MATNLALQLQVIEPDTDLNSIMIGNSRYSDDIWDLRPFIISKNLDLSKTSLRFRYISDTDMKETVKQYTYYKLGKTKPQTVRDYINAKLPMFIEYCSINGIHSFADITLEDYLNFNLWMKDEKKVVQLNNPVPVSLLSGDRKPQIRFLGNHHSGSGNLYHKSFRM